MMSALSGAGSQLVCAAFRAGRRWTPKSAVLITGCSGAGKSTIAAVLARRAWQPSMPTTTPLLARSVDAAGNVVEEEPAEPDFAWLSRRSWAWNPARLDELIRGEAPATLYVRGGAANELELADRFTEVFLLEADEPTMLAQLDARRDYHDWRHIGDTREYTPQAAGNSGPLARPRHDPDRRQTTPDQVVDAIISHTLASSATSQATKPNSLGGTDDGHEKLSMSVDRARPGFWALFGTACHRRPLPATATRRYSGPGQLTPAMFTRVGEP
jgi:hypothetical protein